MRILINIFYIYTALIILFLDWAYLVNWIEPLPDGQHSTSLPYYVYRYENEIVSEASLIIKGKVSTANEYEIIDISDRLIYFKDYYKRYGTIYNIQVLEVYFTDANVVRGNIIRVYSMFSSRMWVDNCIDYDCNDEYIFFFEKIKGSGNSHTENLADYNISLPWSSTILINSEGDYIFSKIFKSLIDENAAIRYRDDLLERHMKKHYREYNNQLYKLLHGNITSEQYRSFKKSILNDIYETWARSDSGFTEDLKAIIQKYKSKKDIYFN